MEDSRVINRISIPVFMINESTVVGSEFRPEGAVGINISCCTFFIKKMVLSTLYIEAE